MYDKVILENGGTLKPVPDCYKNLKTCNETVDNYAYALELVLDFYKAQRNCDIAVGTCPFILDSVSD